MSRRTARPSSEAHRGAPRGLRRRVRLGVRAGRGRRRGLGLGRRASGPRRWSCGSSGFSSSRSRRGARYHAGLARPCQGLTSRTRFRRPVYEGVPGPPRFGPLSFPRPLPSPGRSSRGRRGRGGAGGARVSSPPLRPGPLLCLPHPPAPTGSVAAPLMPCAGRGRVL